MPTLSSSTSSSVSYSSSVTLGDGSTQESGMRHTKHSRTNSDGSSTTHTISQRLGEPVIAETSHYDSAGHHLENGGNGSQGRLTVEDVTDADEQKERDAAYEERMEEEYAKREGGA